MSVADITIKLGHHHVVDTVTTKGIVVSPDEAMRARERSIRIANELIGPKFLLLFFGLDERVLSESVNDKRIGGGRWHYPDPPNVK